MGLDLIVREAGEPTTDEKGRTTYTVTTLGNLRNCWHTFEEFSNRVDTGFGNCATYSFYETTFFVILDTLKEELKNEQDEAEQENYKYEIEQLEEFIKENNLEREENPEYEEMWGRTFEVHAWY